MTNLGSHVVGNCINVRCEDGEHCNTTNNGPESGSPCIDNVNNGQDNEFATLAGHSSVKTGYLPYENE